METHPITKAGHTVSELLEDSGNCRRLIDQELYLLSDSLFSEQKKLRHVLDWAQSFLNSGSDVHHQFCRADSLKLADEQWKKSTASKQSSATTYYHPVSCNPGVNEVFEAFPDEPCISSFTPGGRDKEYRKTHENLKSRELQDVTDKQTSHGNNCRTRGLFMSNQRPHTRLSDRNTSQMLTSDGLTCSVKESTLCNVDSMVFGTGRNMKQSFKTAGAQPESDISGHQMELRKVKVEGKMGTKMKVAKEELEDSRMGKRKGQISQEQESSSAFALYAKNNMSNSEPEKTQERMEKTSNISCFLKTQPTLTVYQQYQRCVDQLHHIRARQSQYTEPGCFIDSPSKDRKTSEEIAPQYPEIAKRLNKAGSKRVTAAEISKERSSGVVNKNQDRSEYNRSRAKLKENGQHQRLTVKETPAASKPVCQKNKMTTNSHLDHDSNTCGALIKATAGVTTSINEVINTHMEQLGTAPGNNGTVVEEEAALTTNPG
ncbi:uncharacterized protein LOC117945002 [Etheostoma cragini]|uniref:uncharacterized protein LOC117945002 n=1 Tax=Etheostoma cragini TaxID=417921 RepID=UPI00155F15A5|nr:uncharacterized protein LOC117945002 [Etheostoma cragini]